MKDKQKFFGIVLLVLMVLGMGYGIWKVNFAPKPPAPPPDPAPVEATDPAVDPDPVQEPEPITTDDPNASSSQAACSVLRWAEPNSLFP